MSDTIGRTFYFPKSLWTKLDDDAKRCRRSSVKQLEAILLTYYRVEDIELDKQSLEILGELMPIGKQKIKVLETSVPEE
jgi:hypothetical protein